MNTIAPIYSIMTPNPDTVDVNTPLNEIRDIFDNKNYHHLPVLEDGKLVGIISHKDYLKVISCAFPNPKQEKTNEKLLKAILAKDIMSKDLVTLDSESSIKEALTIFKTNRFQALPLVRSDGKIEGIVTIFDFLGLVEFLLEEANNKPIEDQFLGL